MVSWRDLLNLSNERLSQYDIAAVNLACAEGLPGTETMDNTNCLRIIADWTEKARWKTQKNFKKFERRPWAFHNSRNYFRALALTTSLQRDCGLRYNRAKMSLHVQFEPADTFVFGALGPDSGTCATMPVLLISVRRRLGYPLRLVRVAGENAGHFFVRWEGNRERFNIESTATGLICPSDNYYRTGQYAATCGSERRGGYLVSLTPRQELAFFLGERFHCWRDIGRWRWAVEAISWAAATAPEFRIFLDTLENTLQRWQEKLQFKMPNRFPKILVTAEDRRFPDALPQKFEQQILKLETIENLLGNRIYRRRWWDPYQHNGYVSDWPVLAEARFNNRGCSSISVKSSCVPF